MVLLFAWFHALNWEQGVAAFGCKTRAELQDLLGAVWQETLLLVSQLPGPMSKVQRKVQRLVH
jgi:hypothetical protein